MEKKEMELKPCPFCGEDPQVIRIKGKDGWRDRYTVRCPYDHGGCGAEGGMYHYEAEAVEAWNRRDLVIKYRTKDLTCNIRFSDDDHVWIDNKQYVSLDRVNKMIKEKAVYRDELEANWEYLLQNVIKSAAEKAYEAILKGETDG